MQHFSFAFCNLHFVDTYEVDLVPDRWDPRIRHPLAVAVLRSLALAFQIILLRFVGRPPDLSVYFYYYFCHHGGLRYMHCYALFYRWVLSISRCGTQLAT